MRQKTVLLTGADCVPMHELAALLIETRAFGLVKLTDHGNSSRLDDAPEPDLIVAYLQEGEGLGAVDAALWARSLAQTSVPLVVVRDVYDEAEALTAFRMGVSEYLGLREHRGRVVAIVAELLQVSLEEKLPTAAGETTSVVETEFAGSLQIRDSACQ
jgi:hypothetical protein